MDQSPSRKKSWGLTPRAFEQLLARLDPDRIRAAQLYERIRQTLMEFFDSRGCLFSEDYTDETIDRVARIIDQGREIENLNRYYFLGVARNVLKEYWRKQKKQAPGLDPQPTVQPAPLDGAEESRLRERCMERCLQRLPQIDRQFIIEYYRGQKGEKIESRKRLAERLELTALQMRKRAFKIRCWLKTCLSDCLNLSLLDGDKFGVSVSNM